MEEASNWGGRFGLWCNPRIVRRMRDLNDGMKPIWAYIQTSALGGNQPSPQLVYSSIWSYLIAGARGLVFFDYIFDGGTLVHVNGMIETNNTAMSSMLTNALTRIQALSDAIMKPEATFAVTVDSANKSVNGVAGIVGGEFGVPIHFTPREDSSYKYLFAQSIRPGTTVGTFTIPAAANKTITVLDEGRTLSANGSGVFTDNFSSDYQVHLYRWS